MQNRKIEIVAYDSDWPKLYDQEVQKLKKALGPALKAIHHIGSTAIPAMAAKPVIDVWLEYQVPQEIPFITQELEKLGYTNLHRNLMPHISFFMHRQDEHIRFHMHIFPVGDPQLQRHVHFRDYLSDHPEEAAEYVKLKKHLAQTVSPDMTQYVVGKGKFVKTIDAKARKYAGRTKKFLAQYPIPATASNQEIITAMEVNFNLRMTYYAQFIPAIEFIRVPGYVSVNTKLRDHTLNYVLDTHLSEQDVAQKVQQITEYFTKQQLPFTWWISPHDSPQHLAEQFEKNAFTLAKTKAAMAITLDTWDTQNQTLSELKIVRALDLPQLEDFALMCTKNPVSSKTYASWLAQTITEEDPIEYYVGYLNEQCIVRGLICIYGGIVGLYALATAKHAFADDATKQMQWFCLQRAKTLGYHVAVSLTSANAVPQNERATLKPCGEFLGYQYQI